MTGLKINIDDLVSDGDDSLTMSYGGLCLGELTVSSEGLTTSTGHRYGLSPEDLIASETGFLGKGSSGLVRRATHRSTGEVFALKEIKVTSQAHLKEIRRELETLHREGNTSLYLVGFHGAFCHEGSVFIAMECMDGSLDSVAKPVPTEVLASMSRSILCGLWDLHRNRHLIHRDLKPSNILYSQDGDIKISDFGVSSSLECTRGDAHSFVGTLAYMSPERLKGESYSFSADIWSFGLVIAELALGKPLFIEKFSGGDCATEAGFWILLEHLSSDKPVILLPPSIDPRLAEFILLCIHKEPGERPTCEDLLRHPFVTQVDKCDCKEMIRQWLFGLRSTDGVAAAPEYCNTAHTGPEAGSNSSLNLDDELNKLLC